MTFEFKHVSPSQIEVWLSCQGKWYWQYPMGFKPPSSAGQAVGTACHTVIEDVLATKEDCGRKNDPQDRYRDIVRPALPKLFELRERVANGALVETEMKRTLRNGLVLKGRIDFLHVARPRALVVDHKNTKDLKYAKTEEELRTDIQLNAYAYEALCRDGGITHVAVAHSVCRTQGAPAHRYTEVEIPARDIHATWTRIQDISDKMIETSKITSPADVPKNRDACSKFGGCPHLARCEALWGTASTNPYAGIESALTVHTDPVTQENRMSTGAIPASVLAALGKVPAARSPLTPPEAPASPREVKIQAAQVAVGAEVRAGTLQVPPATPPANVAAILGGVKAQQPAAPKPAAPAPAPVVAKVETPALPADGPDLLLALGWTEEEVNAMTDEVFEKTVAAKAARADVDVKFGEPEDDGFRAIVDVFEKVVEVKPARAQRVARVGAPLVAEVPLTPAEPYVAPVPPAADQTTVADPPRRRGRPPGSKNKATLEREAQAGAVETQVEQPAAQVVQRTVLDRATGPGTDGASDGQQGQTTVEECDREDADLTAAMAEIERLRKENDDLRERADVAATEIGGVLLLLEQGSFPAHLDLANKVATWAKDNVAARIGRAGDLPFVLYVDCLPETSGVPFRTLDSVLVPFMELAAKNYKNEKTGQPEPLTHYSLIPFGKGPAVVVAYLLANLAEVVQPGVLYVDSRSPCAAAALEVLRPKADLVVSARGR